MQKSDYQQLRFSVEAAIHDYDSGSVDSVDLLNNVMRLFLQASSAAQVRDARARRDLLTFRRNPDLLPPAWALRNPSLSSRLPQL